VPSIASFHSGASVPRTTSAAPTSHSDSAVSFRPSPSFENSHVPRRSSQVPRPVSRTYSVHNLEDCMPLPNDYTHNSWPQYQFSQPLNGGDDQAMTIHFPTVIRKVLGMNIAHATNLPLMRPHLMRTIGWQERLFKVLTSITMISY